MPLRAWLPYALFSVLVAAALPAQTDSPPLVTSTTESESPAFSVLEGSVGLEAPRLTTRGPSSPGVVAGGQSTVSLVDATVVTSGAASPALAAVGGRLVVTGGTMRTSGAQSPGLRATSSVRVTGAVLVATASEAVVAEGAPALAFADTTLVGSRWAGIAVGQTLAGGPVSLTLEGGSLTAREGPLFALRGGSVTVQLKQVTLAEERLLASVDGSGVLNGDGQTLVGDVELNTAAVWTMNLRNTSSWTGSVVVQPETRVTVGLDATSTWTLTGEARVTTLTLIGGEATLARCVLSGGHTLWYKASANAWLNGRTLVLSEGGRLAPF